MNEVIGICSICGGDVVCPKVFHSAIPPHPTCTGCGAVATGGPVIDMRPNRRHIVDAVADNRYVREWTGTKIDPVTSYDTTTANRL